MGAVSSLGRFEILQELGRGGMGVVFRAHDPAMARDVALKVLRLDTGLDASEENDVRRRFEREAKAAGGLNHPNIVAHYERGEAGGYHFIVMELVNGRALHRVMCEEPRPDLKTSLSILRQMAAALDYAHSRGVVHRDIKPANVLLPVEGGLKIVDFGIAKSSAVGSMTASSMVLGSPHYMSPEQIEGREVTGQTDQWGLAVTAYELLAGRRPFDSESIATLFQQILAQQPRDPSEFDPSLPSAARMVFQRALSKASDERYPSCAEFVEALAKASSQSAATSEPAAGRPAKNRARSWLWAGSAALAVLLAGVVVVRLLPFPAKLSPGQTTMAAPPATKVDASFKAGKTRINRRDNLTYIWIAPGTFRMGCSPGDTDCHDDETAHDVTLTKGYWFGQTEVTVDAFRHFSLATEAAMPRPPDDNPNWADSSKPISNVNWNSAAAYCSWGMGRLPTEAEWEFAARGGAPQMRYGPIDRIAWFGGNSKGRASAVKGLLPNDLGLYDTLGNLWEWTADLYGRDYYGQSPVSDPRGAQTGEFRVLRGGSWLRSAAEIRVSLRYPALPNSPDQLIGFRCACDDLP